MPADAGRPDVDDGRLDVMTSLGANLVRLRLWHEPTAEAPHSGREEVLAMCLRAQDADHDVLLDIFYSAWWADPGSQATPEPWQGLALSELTTEVRSYTRDVLAYLTSGGCNPSFVQLGNEIDNGMLWPVGYVDGEDTAAPLEDWQPLRALLVAAGEGVSDAYPSSRAPRTIVHTSSMDGALEFYRRLEQLGVPYDVIGLSFYPFIPFFAEEPRPEPADYTEYDAIDDLATKVGELVAAYDKDVLVVETAYPYSLDNTSGEENWIQEEWQVFGDLGVSVAGQRQYLADLGNALTAIPGGRGLGFVYWAPDWYRQIGATPMVWDNLALYRPDGAPVHEDPPLAGATPTWRGADLSFLPRLESAGAFSTSD